jgi:hypothetical protein
LRYQALPQAQTDRQQATAQTPRPHPSRLPAHRARLSKLIGTNVQDAQGQPSVKNQGRRF